MAASTFDYTLDDAQAMPVEPVEPRHFDLARYEAYAAEADERYAAFLQRDEGVAVWQRVRVAEVFRDGCRDMHTSLRAQLGGLVKSLDYLTDAPTYLEPWYGIGTTASAFGAEYLWSEGQAPAIPPLYTTLEQVPQLVPLDFDEVPILQHTLRMLDYFLEETKGCLPISWSDLQHPLNVATELVETRAFLLGTLDDPHKVRAILEAITQVIIEFTQIQSERLGQALARPGHGFASSRVARGIGLSADNLVMLSPRLYGELCAELDARLGEQFGGTGIHSCGNWARWIPAVRHNPSLAVVDGAFTRQTDPAPNEPEPFRDAFATSGVIVHARMVGESQEVIEQVQRLWAPGMKLIVTTYVQNPAAQHQLYHDIHALCS